MEKIDIYIKSFNRAYYLERCIRSIYQFVAGSFRIIILDDGTPDVYLKRIEELFPDVEVVKSDYYSEKSHALQQHIEQRATYNLNTIPSEFWFREISKASSIFLLLEEDAWITHSIQIDELTNSMIRGNLCILKIGWNGSQHLVSGHKEAISPIAERIVPKLPLDRNFILTAILTNKFKFRSLLYKLKIITPAVITPYYTLYTVTSALFEKNYWLYLWETSGNLVNEGDQLLQALKWKEHYASNYGKTIQEVVKTSFVTSSTNRFSAVDFDMITLNHHLNEAWLSGALSWSENFPRDFDITYLTQFIQFEDADMYVDQWKSWISMFKKIYREIDCVVD
jgi:glycosyltransferase involved in cell wall biosynthesis